VSRSWLLLDDLTNVRFIRAVALARHACAALATKLFIPCTIGMALTDPADTKANGQLLFITMFFRNVVL
jgi:hypothetical protein